MDPPNCMMHPPQTITASPIHVEGGTASLNINCPVNTLTTANTATYTPSSFEKSHRTRLTTTP